MQALDQAAPGDGLGQFLNRDARLDAAHIGLAEGQRVERDVARGGEGDLLRGIGHGSCSTAGTEGLSPGSQPATKRQATLWLSGVAVGYFVTVSAGGPCGRSSIHPMTLRCGGLAQLQGGNRKSLSWI